MVRAAALAALVALGCAHAPGSTRLLVARTTTADGATIELHRFRPDAPDPRPLLLVPELGFSPALVTPLARRLQHAGWDVAVVVGRHLLEPRSDAGWDGWVSDVARAARVHGDRPVVLAIGLGGAAAWPLAAAGGTRAVVAVNVPLSPLDGTRLRRAVLDQLGLDPARWLDARPDDALVLLAGGNTSDPSLAAVWRRLARPLPARLSVEATRVLTVPGVFPLPTAPLALVVGPRDAFVPTEESMVALDAPKVRFARRLGRVEAFHRHYGHLDWLAGDEALDDVVPTLLEALEAVK